MRGVSNKHCLLTFFIYSDSTAIQLSLLYGVEGIKNVSNLSYPKGWRTQYLKIDIGKETRTL